MTTSSDCRIILRNKTWYLRGSTQTSSFSQTSLGISLWSILTTILSIAFHEDPLWVALTTSRLPLHIPSPSRLDERATACRLDSPLPCGSLKHDSKDGGDDDSNDGDDERNDGDDESKDFVVLNNVIVPRLLSRLSSNSSSGP